MHVRLTSGTRAFLGDNVILLNSTAVKTRLIAYRLAEKLERNKVLQTRNDEL